MSSTPVAQRRHPDVDDVQPVVEILAERLVGNALDQDAIGRGDDAHVDARLDLIGADALNFAGLEESEQQALHARARLADFVHEDGAAVRLLERTEPIAVGAGEAAPDVTEELGLEQRLRKRRAVDRDERRAAARAAGVNEARDDFLARPALAGDQNLGVAARRVEDFFLEVEDRRTRPDELGGLHKGATSS